MPLNKQQIDHAKARIRNISAEKLAKRTEKFGPKPEVPALSFADKYALISAGKAVLRPISELYHNIDLVDAYRYPTAYAKERKARDAWSDKCKAVECEIQQEATALLDKLMLGSPKDALSSITEFEQSI